MIHGRDATRQNPTWHQASLTERVRGHTRALVVSRKLDWENAMEWLRRHAWQPLLGMTALIAILGLNPVAQGIHEDPTVPLAFTGRSADQLQSDNPDSFRLIDVQARFTGLDLS